jgi:amino acid transporter
VITIFKLLNLILGRSRVLLAMGRRGDVPRILARLNSPQTTPDVAVGVVGGAIALLVLVGDVNGAANIIRKSTVAIDSMIERVGRGPVTNPLRIKLWADSSPKVCP